MKTLASFLSDQIESLGVHSELVMPLCVIVITLGALIVLSAIYGILHRFVEPRLKSRAGKTETKLDDILFLNNVPKLVWLLIVSILAYSILPYLYGDYKVVADVAQMVLRLTLIIVIAKLIASLVKTGFAFLAFVNKKEDFDPQRLNTHSLKGLQQMCVVIIYGVSIILIISVLINKDPVILFSGLGAMAAVLMLIFQDSILGVVAGIQLTANDMMKPGDWVVVPKYGANGIVTDITLATVKISNWDNSTTTIQPYKLITEGFQNWRSMIDQQGRRIARSINIDMNSIRFGSPEEVAAWRSAEWGKMLPAEGDIVNLTAYRTYLHHYIQTVPTFIPSMLYMIRELEPDSNGLPLEVYFFTSCTEWKSYEQVQSDTFDSIIARLSDFDLRIHQTPTGSDLRSLSSK